MSSMYTYCACRFTDMVKWTIIFLIIVTLLVPSSRQIPASGPRCLDCKGVSSVTRCRHTSDCWSHEICYGEKVLHSNGSEWYNFGCKTNEECDAISFKKVRRFDIELRTCQKCCNGRLCNAELCHHETNLIACFACKDAVNSQSCDNVILCDSNQECYAEKMLNHGLHPSYNLECAPESICSAIRTRSVVKRSVQKRSTYLCQRCCREAGCNAGICDMEMTPATNTSTTSSTISPTTLSATPVAPPDATPDAPLPTTELPTSQNASNSSTTSIAFTTDATTSANTTTAIEISPSTVIANATTATSVTGTPIGKDCWELRNKYHVNVSGRYELRRPQSNENITAWCDMETDGGGWIVFQRRTSGNLTFKRNWHDFQEGFGDMDSEFWRGNKFVHEFSQNEAMILRIDIADTTHRSMYAEYGNFSLSNNSEYYRLNVGGFRGSAGHILYYFQNPTAIHARHAGQPFSTLDNDHDNWSGNCANYSGGGFWHDACCSVCLNGEFKIINGDACMGSVVGDITLTCVQRTEMKFRPASVPSASTDLFQDPPPKRT